MSITTEAPRSIRSAPRSPALDAAVALLSYALVVLGLAAAFLLFTTERVAANFLTFGPLTLFGFGVVVPLLYTRLAMRRPLTDLGITTRLLGPSLVLGMLLGLDTYLNTLGRIGVTWDGALVPLVALALTVGLFEAIFFRGWLQGRLEASLGMVPGLVLAAALYAVYHVGYGMTLPEMVPLFGYGLVFGAVYRLTRNIFVLWPFYTPVGGLYATLGDGVVMPFEATYGFVLVLAAMAVTTWVVARRGDHTVRT